MSGFTIRPEDAERPVSSLYKPWKVRDLEFCNRIMVAPMCTYTAPESKINDWHISHYGALAMGGSGALCVEATAVESRGRISSRCIGIWDDSQIEGWKRVTDLAHTYTSSKLGIQLAHSGRKGVENLDKGGFLTEADGIEILAPSTIPYAADRPIKAPASLDTIKKTIQLFADAAERSVKAGFDYIEIHSAHGYLLHQFLSPLSNDRTDQYGGSLENRCRMTVEVATAVRRVLPDKMPLFVRISATDWYEGGWDVPSSVYLSKKLGQIGVDAIHVSSGGLHPDQDILIGWHYQLPFATQIKREANIPVICVGGINDAEDAAGILDNGEADCVALAREFLRNPYWPRSEALRLGMSIPVPPQEARGYGKTARATATELKKKQNEAEAEAIKKVAAEEVESGAKRGHH